MLIFAIFLVLIALTAFITCSIVGGAAKKKVAETKDDWECRSYTKVVKSVTRVKWIATIGALVILIIVLVIGGIRVVDETEVGVVKTFGEISGTVDSGLNFINPLTQKVTMYDLRVHVRESSFASYTKDAQPLTAAIEYQYALNPAFAEDVAREYGSYEILETKLSNIVEERAKIVFAHYSAMPLLENRSNLSTEVAEEVKTIENLFHVTFTSVVVKDIDFSDAFEASVEAKMTAEQAALKAEQDKKTAIIQAEQKKEVAAITAEAAIAQAKGEAEALEITRQALQNMPDTWVQQLWIEKWDGKLPTTQAGSDAAIIVNPNIGN
jgi:regulator of protease activity HflC (stomatin/prohibitin superfamily)